MNRWTQLTQKDDPTAHIRKDVIPFVLTDSERSIAAQASVQLERHRREENARDAQQGLAAWKGQMHRVGEGL